MACSVCKKPFESLELTFAHLIGEHPFHYVKMKHDPLSEFGDDLQKMCYEMNKLCPRKPEVTKKLTKVNKNVPSVSSSMSARLGRRTFKNLNHKKVPQAASYQRKPSQYTNQSSNNRASLLGDIEPATPVLYKSPPRTRKPRYNEYANEGRKKSMPMKYRERRNSTDQPTTSSASFATNDDDDNDDDLAIERIKAGRKTLLGDYKPPPPPPPLPLSPPPPPTQAAACGTSRIYKCKWCEQIFTKPVKAAQHDRVKHGDLAPFVCPICKFYAPKAQEIADHMINEHERLQCNMCKSEFDPQTGVSAFTDHLRKESFRNLIQSYAEQQNEKIDGYGI